MTVEPEPKGPSGVALSATSLPDPDYRRRLAALVGVNHVTDALRVELSLIVRPDSLQAWALRCNLDADLLSLVRRRCSLFILAGDVGTGKTEIAETIGDAVARDADMPVTLFRMGLGTRGSGLVGEMSKLIADGFAEVTQTAKRWKGGRSIRAGGILLIDEADALAQSRELSQMHHEDRAGVNALIRGIDDLARAEVPVATILATNRLFALDPAVRRRAARTFELGRPTAKQREDLFRRYLTTLSRFEAKLPRLVSMTGESPKHPYGFTYSDLTQRLIPEAVMAAYPDSTVTMELIIEVAERMVPTPSFERRS